MATTTASAKTTPRVISDKTAEAQRLISNANAAKAIESIKKSAPTEKKPKEKPAEKAPKAPKYPTFTSALDAILKVGGTWAEMIEKSNQAKAELEALHPDIPVVFNGKPKLMSLVKYRMEKQKLADYLGGKKVTPEGIF